jgi:lytic murein transglycosylase
MRSLFACFALSLALATPAAAVQCANTGGKFDTWKQGFTAQARNAGISEKALKAFASTTYSQKTINADRNQKSFKLSLDQFMEKRGAAAIVAQGRKQKRTNAKLFAALEKRYGVPAGPLIAIWGMETAFGRFSGNQNTLSAVATLAYDCRRTEFFTEQLYAALELIDKGALSASAKGAMHGEVGQTQFMPKNVLLYGADADGGGVNLNSKADALASTAKFLVGHGWQRGEDYQPGDPNYVAIQGWNAAKVYQQAIAIIGQKIDEN